MKYFTFWELERSETADRLKLKNNPTPEDEERMRLLVDRLLDPLRERWGKPLIVTSGYRSEAINRAVGGAKSSQHLRGEAVDITAGSPQLNRELARLIVRVGLAFDQLIDEQGYKWVHLSYREGQNRRQMLRIKDGKTEKLIESEI